MPSLAVVELGLGDFVSGGIIAAGSFETETQARCHLHSCIDASRQMRDEAHVESVVRMALRAVVAERWPFLMMESPFSTSRSSPSPTSEKGDSKR